MENVNESFRGVDAVVFEPFGGEPLQDGGKAAKMGLNPGFPMKKCPVALFRVHFVGASFFNFYDPGEVTDVPRVSDQSLAETI